LKQNTFTSILNLRLRGSLCLTLIFHALLLMKFGMNVLKALGNFVQSFKLKFVLNLNSFKFRLSNLKY
jgi:hypothetical protein